MKNYLYIVTLTLLLVSSCGKRDVHQKTGLGGSGSSGGSSTAKGLGVSSSEDKPDQGGDGDFVGNGGDDRVLVNYLDQASKVSFLSHEKFSEHRVRLDNIIFEFNDVKRLGYCYEFYSNLYSAANMMVMLDEFVYQKKSGITTMASTILEGAVPDMINAYGQALQQKNYELLCDPAYFQIGYIETEQGVLTAANFERSPFETQKNRDSIQGQSEYFIKSTLPLIVVNPMEWSRLKVYSHVCEHSKQSKDCLERVRMAIAYHEYVTARYGLESHNSYRESSKLLSGYYIDSFKLHAESF